MACKKKLKQIGLILLVIAAVIFYGTPLVVLLCGHAFDIPVQQPVENIREIALLDTSLGEEKVLYILSEEETVSFMSQLLEMKAARYVNDPATEYGRLAAKIFYEDGGFDIVGCDLIVSVLPSGEEITRGWYYVKFEELSELFAQYVEKDMLPA